MLKNYDGYPVAVTEKNPSGPRLIVLLHGFGASTFSWRTVIDELAELGHVIAYDRPGFGVTPLVERTPTDDPYSLAGQVRLLGKLVEAESAGRPVVLVGHSAGALVATQFVLENPEVASALVLESPQSGGSHRYPLRWPAPCGGQPWRSSAIGCWAHSTKPA